MTGIKIWQTVEDLRDTLMTWVEDVLIFFTTPINDWIKVNPLPENLGEIITNAIASILELFGSPSILELMFSSFSLIIILSLVKWVIGIIT